MDHGISRTDPIAARWNAQPLNQSDLYFRARGHGRRHTHNLGICTKHARWVSRRLLETPRCTLRRSLRALQHRWSAFACTAVSTYATSQATKVLGAVARTGAHQERLRKGGELAAAAPWGKPRTCGKQET